MAVWFVQVLIVDRLGHDLERFGIERNVAGVVYNDLFHISDSLEKLSISSSRAVSKTVSGHLITGNSIIPGQEFTLRYHRLQHLERSDLGIRIVGAGVCTGDRARRHRIFLFGVGSHRNWRGYGLAKIFKSVAIVPNELY